MIYFIVYFFIKFWLFCEIVCVHWTCIFNGHEIAIYDLEKPQLVANGTCDYEILLTEQRQNSFTPARGKK